MRHAASILDIERWLRCRPAKIWNCGSPYGFGDTEMEHQEPINRSAGFHVPTNLTDKRIERLPHVLARVGLKRSSVYAYIAAKRFPAPIRLGPNSVGWLADDIDQWIADRIRETRPTAPQP
jgi:prophage regulatory protein